MSRPRCPTPSGTWVGTKCVCARPINSDVTSGVNCSARAQLGRPLGDLDFDLDHLVVSDLVEVCEPNCRFLIGYCPRRHNRYLTGCCSCYGWDGGCYGYYIPDYCCCCQKTPDNPVICDATSYCELIFQVRATCTTRKSRDQLIYCHVTCYCGHMTCSDSVVVVLRYF